MYVYKSIKNREICYCNFKISCRLRQDRAQSSTSRFESDALSQFGIGVNQKRPLHTVPLARVLF